MNQDTINARAEMLVNWVRNDRISHTDAQFAVSTLRRLAKRAAKRLAAERAAIHDDPTLEDHAEHHAPWDDQFPKEAAHQAIVDLVDYYVTEMELWEEQEGGPK